jgi:hypothetical protein
MEGSSFFCADWKRTQVTTITPPAISSHACPLPAITNRATPRDEFAVNVERWFTLVRILGHRLQENRIVELIAIMAATRSRAHSLGNTYVKVPTFGDLWTRMQWAHLGVLYPGLNPVTESRGENRHDVYRSMSTYSFSASRRQANALLTNFYFVCYYDYFTQRALQLFLWSSRLISTLLPRTTNPCVVSWSVSNVLNRLS